MVNVKVHTTLNLFQNPRAMVAITHDDDWIGMVENNPSSSSHFFDIGKLRSFLLRSREAVQITNEHICTRNGLGGDSDSFSDGFVTPPDSPFTLPPGNVNPEPPNTLNNVAPFSISISPFNPSQTLHIPSSSEMLSDSLGILLTQHGGPTSTDDAYPDLTDHVMRSDSHPFTSGGFGDIYRGNLNVAGRLVNVSHRSFFSGRLSKH